MKWQDFVFPDALAAEKVYRVTGAPLDKTERCAAENLSTSTLARTRELRFRAWAWPGAPTPNDDVLVMMQYRFLHALPAMACPSIARLVHLVRTAGTLHIKQTFTFDTTHHGGVEGVQFIDLTGDGGAELLVESDNGGAGSVASDLTVFSLKEGRFRQWLNVPSRALYSSEEEEVFTQTLDVPRTQATRATQFCFTMTTFVENSKTFRKPRVTDACYPRFTGPSARVQW